MRGALMARMKMLVLPVLSGMPVIRTGALHPLAGMRMGVIVGMGMPVRMRVGVFFPLMHMGVGMRMGVPMFVFVAVFVERGAVHGFSSIWAVRTSLENLTPRNPPISTAMRSMSAGEPWMKMVSRQLW